MSNEFTDYDRRSFEHSANEDLGTDDARVVEVDDDAGTVTVETDQGRYEMTTDEDGFPHVVKGE